MWGGKSRAKDDVRLFAPFLIDARYHFSNDDVTMVKPTWFCSDGVINYLVDYLFAKGMIDRTNKPLILSNAPDRPKNDIYMINARNREIAKMRRRQERIAEEGEE
jgi:hypothetical protein